MTWGLLFDGSRTQVFVTALPPWPLDTTALANTVAGPWPFLFGPNITTISQIGGGNGSYSKAAGTLVLPLKLRFDHSRDVPFYEEDSNLSIVFSTANPGGSPVTAAGAVTLTGSGVFSGGWLNGVTCTMVVTGTLAPLP